jgi:hypothetical protein
MPRALYPEQRIPVSIKQESVWVAGVLRKEIPLGPAQDSNPDRPVRSSAAITASHKYEYCVGPKSKELNQMKK